LYLTVDKIKSTICEKQIPNFYSDPWPKENRELCVYPGPKLDLSRFQIADYFQERLHLIRAAPGKLSYCGKLLQKQHLNALRFSFSLRRVRTVWKAQMQLADHYTSLRFPSSRFDRSCHNLAPFKRKLRRISEFRRSPFFYLHNYEAAHFSPQRAPLFK
jgi:hypothetical protein